jgi:hypothetical protein
MDKTRLRKRRLALLVFVTITLLVFSALAKKGPEKGKKGEQGKAKVEGKKTNRDHQRDKDRPDRAKAEKKKPHGEHPRGKVKEGAKGPEGKGKDRKKGEHPLGKEKDRDQPVLGEMRGKSLALGKGRGRALGHHKRGPLASEQRKHFKRIAKLERLKKIATETNNENLLEKIEKLTKKEGRRHKKAWERHYQARGKKHEKRHQDHDHAKHDHPKEEKL